MIIYKDKISTIEYDHVSQNITYSERGIANKELLLSQLRSVMEFSKTQTISSVIADFRNMRGSFKSIFDFLNEIYYPTLKSRGLICNAIVVSDDIINNHLANLLLEDLKKQGIDAATFGNTRAATKWVHTCKEVAQNNKIFTTN